MGSMAKESAGRGFVPDAVDGWLRNRCNVRMGAAENLHVQRMLPTSSGIDDVALADPIAKSGPETICSLGRQRTKCAPHRTLSSADGNCAPAGYGNSGFGSCGCERD